MRRAYTARMLASIVVVGVVALLALAVAGRLWTERSRLLREATERTRTLGELTASLGARERETGAAREEAAGLRARIQEFEKQRTEQAATLDALHKRFQDTFDSLAGKALAASSQQFLELAKKTFEAEHEKAKGDLEARRNAVDALLKPIGDTLKMTDEKLAAMEKERGSAYAGLLEQVRAMGDVGRRLDARTSDLVAALRKPQVRGRYGEIQLERVVELSGMRQYCDFATQESARDDEGRLVRPDAIVRLPNERCVAIDAKTNIEAYLDAIEADGPEAAEAHLDRFARHVAEQAGALAKKEYWSRFEGSPEFVVMFIPGDQFIDAAIQRRPDLLDFAAQRGVVLASPSTLIGLLRAVHVGWREKSLSDSAKELFALGRTLHERAANAFEHLNRVGGALRQAVERFNGLVGSVDQMLSPAIRRFESAGAKSAKELPETPPVEVVVREARLFEARGADGAHD